MMVQVAPMQAHGAGLGALKCSASPSSAAATYGRPSWGHLPSRHQHASHPSTSSWACHGPCSLSSSRYECYWSAHAMLLMGHILAALFCPYETWLNPTFLR